jgi:hypothetical protein
MNMFEQPFPRYKPTKFFRSSVPGHRQKCTSIAVFSIIGNVKMRINQSKGGPLFAVNLGKLDQRPSRSHLINIGRQNPIRLLASL